MGWTPLENLKIESRLEDQFWKQKTWDGFKNETDVETLKKAIQLLIETVAQKQSMIKSLIDFTIQQDLEVMKTPVDMQPYKDLITELQPETTA